MNKILIFLLGLSLSCFPQVLLPSDVKSTPQQTEKKEEKKQTQPIPQKQTKTQKKDKKIETTPKTTAKAKKETTAKVETKTIRKETANPIDEKALENILISLQQQIAIEKKKNELLKLQKENKELTEATKPQVVSPPVITPTKEEKVAPYYYISGEGKIENENTEINIVGIGNSYIIVKDGEKYYELTEGMKYKGHEIVKIFSDGVLIKRGEEIKKVGLSYQPVKEKEQVKQMPTPEIKEEKK